MQAKQTNLLQFLQGAKQFIIPIYQRTYSWRVSECEQLWHDILRVAQNEAIPTHFLGSIVYVSKGVFVVSSVPQLLVIDGQQRLTTLFLFLAALGEAFKAQGDELEWNKICEYYLFNKFERGDGHYKLLLTQGDKNTLISILEGSEEPEQASVHLKENYQFFKQQIADSLVSLETLYKGINKLIIVDIALEQHDNPQLIFESLNSTGVDLSQTDLIRNYILMGLDNDEQIKLYNTYWHQMERTFAQGFDANLFNRFMRDYLTLRTGTIPNVDKVYAAFKAYHQDRLHISMEAILAEIYEYSKYFTHIIMTREKDPELRRCFEDIRTLELNVAYPFLLEVYYDYEHQKLSREDFVAILQLIESYIFRRLICGIPTQGLNRVFALLAKEIDKEHYRESIQAIFLQRSSSGRFPRDEEFRPAFMVKDIYNFRNRGYLFGKLENHKRLALLNVSNYTVEHIMPRNKNLSLEWQQELGSNWQEVQARYLHTIGNLTLTVHNHNAEMSDRPFREKRQVSFGLTQSGLQLNASLEGLEHWNEQEIEKRAKILAEVAIQIWQIPALMPEQINKYGRRAQRAPLEEILGPVDHPLAGFIPAGYRILPANNKRFHYYRQINGEWVPYGNGKVAWYALSWASVGKNIRSLARKNEKPLGSGGEIHPRYAKVANGDNQALEQNDDIDEQKTYTIEQYTHLQGPMLGLFESLRKRILNLDPSVKEEYKKLYIAYKISTNFVDVEPHKNHLCVFLNMPFDEIDDPKNLCRDITIIGHHGNGDIDIRFSSIDQLDDVMDLIQQAFEEHAEDGAA